MAMTRREAMGAVAAGTVAAAVMLRDTAANAADSQGVSRKPSEAKSTAVLMKPLPFDPKKLPGISEKMIVSHWENNYGSAIKNLNKVQEEIGRFNKDSPGYLVGSIREKELTFANSRVLHELYFGNLGGDGKATGPIVPALAEVWGSAARWEELFRATGASLSGGTGWVILAWSLHDGALRTFWSGNHTQVPAFAAPVLVMDMYEHAYQMDYGAAATRYIDAFFQNIDWAEVNRRYERASKLGAPYGVRGT